MGKNLEAAIKYATKYKWAVFPVDSKTKKPITPHGCKDAKTIVGAIKAWWSRYPDASIGIATGSASNLIVIDKDVDYDKGLDGKQSVYEWEKLHSPLPETVVAVTGRGGEHWYYHYTGSDIGNRAGILEGVDVRGEGGYVIAPPSIHPNGTEYYWEASGDPDEVPIAELNDVVKEFLSIGTQRKHSGEFQLPETIAAGARNDTLYRLACSLQAQGIPDEAILAAVLKTNASACIEPLEDEEVHQIVSSALKHAKGEMRVIAKTNLEWHEPELSYQVDKNGEVTDRPAQTIKNAVEAITYDKNLFGRIRYNSLAYTPYVYGNMPWLQHRGWREWTNNDDSNLRCYIENKYGLKNSDKIMDALKIVAESTKINPVMEMLEECLAMWDGNKYIENLLPQMLGVKKTEYSIAVMKLFMYGAISRIYHPGCKFDYMLVLVGAQGKGKSSFLRYLALNDAWYNDNFSTLDSARAIENLRGMWIVELAELQATKRAKDVETIKSFITSRVDTYREPYNRRTEQRPRMCVLAGTSNPVDFLTDKTGNRRFLPITCNEVEPLMDMFADENATKAIFAQAWGEAMHDFQEAGGKPRLTMPERLFKAAVEAQEAYLEEDPYIGMVQEWLDTNEDIDRVCAIMLWREALQHAFNDPTKKDINELHDIMKNSIKGWKYVGRQRVGVYGVQRCYVRTEKRHIIDV